MHPTKYSKRSATGRVLIVRRVLTGVRGSAPPLQIGLLLYDQDGDGCRNNPDQLFFRRGSLFAVIASPTSFQN